LSSPGDSGRERLLPSAHSLVGPNGKFALGLRTRPFREVNPLDADLRVGPLALPKRAKGLTLKEWQHFALVNEEVYVSVALFDAKRIALAQIIVYDRRSDRLYEYEQRCLPRDIKLADQLYSGDSSFRRGDYHLRFSNRLEQGFHEVHLAAPSDRRQPHLEGRFELFEDLANFEAMVVALPFDSGRAMYSHKAVLPIEGVLELGDRRIRFERESSYGLVDVHKGFYPFVMTWHWGTGALWSEGKLLGFNLTDNQVQDQRRFNENGLWVDGHLSPLPPVRFEFNPRQHLEGWRVRDNFGRVDLSFTPDTLRSVDINLGVLRSRYRGPFGHFRGTIVDDAGTRHDLEDAYGMCEDFYLRA
jgi:hypothetical protein